jgi:RNA polymerase sigma factor (sigma-70 family)
MARRSTFNFTLSVFIELSLYTRSSCRGLACPPAGASHAGGLGMHNSIYSLFFESDPAQICETLNLGYHEPAGQADGWTEEELLHIRLVLRKLTALRIENPADAEDLVQETLLTMLRKAPETELEKGRLIWAMGILRRKVGNYYRKAQRSTSRSRQVRHAQEFLSIVPSPETNLHHSELVDRIDRFLLSLPPQERAAMDLYLAGRQTCEIVSVLHPERYQNIVNRLHRSRKKLARELARYGYARHASARLRKRTAS